MMHDQSLPLKPLIFFALLYFLAAALTISIGPTPWYEVFNGALSRIWGSHTEWNPLLDERLPRLVVLSCTGASLAVSGFVLQSLFHNPLASPSILGISCGGSLSVTFAYIMGWQAFYPYAIPMAAFCGCLLTLLFVYAFSRATGEAKIPYLILTGIAVSTLLLAMKGAITYALRDNWQLIQIITEWEAGSTADRNWKHVHMQLPLTLIGLYGCLYYSREINLLALGEEEAKNLGVEVSVVRWRLFLCVALLTGGAIAAVGIIAFFGLVLPNLLREVFGADSCKLLPINAVAGAAALLLLDDTLRIFDLHAFSIGNISAILGGVFFIFLLFQYQNRRRFSGV